MLYSCQKEIGTPVQKIENAVFPTSEKEKQTVATLIEVKTILQEVYKHPKAFYEVCATIYSGYYEDERVLLKDLLFPEYSKLYSTSKFNSLRSEKGLFKKEFLEAFNKGEYPNLKKAFGISSASNYRVDVAPTDTSMEIFSNSNGVAIYFPYSENFGTTLTADYFDNINTDPFGNMATVIPADREANSAPGNEPYRYKKTVNNEIQWEIRYRAVTVDDLYAEGKPTHIVGVGAEPTKINPANPPPGTNVVFIGEVKCTNQFDRFISWSNSGGSELRFCRGSGFLTQDGNGQITNPQNVVQVNATRKQIRKGQWISVYSIWDADWQQDNLNQVFAIYEEDTQGTQTVNLSLATTVTLSPGNTAVRTVGFSFTLKTQDDIIRQLAWSRQSFFQYNQGGLNNGCGTRNSWTVYDCNSYVSYTMPTQ